ncbi:DNA mismatch repair protein MutS [Winogradskyella sp. D23]|uniref:DNA mismatch repair protein MutS n=2 Tax=Winogradskyella alexanderae TaxID=2877123 RepID=A0ABS7XQ23_9FLAO|nr:DNA mismatch repair protein MutS [Winogradskyella alexanderae]MCA0131136.1 DNA mismatch repair protein MutS [Winogradskyella alexanderae]
MENTEFYNLQIAKFTQESKQIFKQLSVLSVLRLTVFLSTVGIVYLLRQQWQWAFLSGLIGTVIFLALLSRYTDLKAKRALCKRLIKLNEEEISINNGQYYHREDGIQFQNSNHYYSLDIDLFGKGSFFQYMNRTNINEGMEKLSNILLANNINGIENRQQAIKELAEIPNWTQLYAGLAQGIKTEYKASKIITWLKEYKPFLRPFHYWLSISFSALSTGILAMVILQYMPIKVAGYWLLIGLGITGIYVKRINILSQNTERTKNTFRQYALLLDQIENQSFTSELLKTQQQKLKLGDVKASKIFSEFTKALDALDNRNNFISAIFGNGYFLWDILQSYRVERWIIKYADKVEDWFSVVVFFDAFNSLGTYAYNHKDYVFPKIINDNTSIKANELGHPLLQVDKRIASNLELNKNEFFIVTGANMAGKSTFLRTVGLHIVMANIGLPVCAKSSHYTPIKLITSMRTTDSLKDDSSYFFSELTRLKFIVDTITTEDNYFVILDEILKGTNSTDKAIGSKKFVERLVNIKATGIIATHDLSLTKIEDELEPVKNYFFDAQIINEELYFDYKLKKGVCSNMNASFLLKKMEIV